MKNSLSYTWLTSLVKSIHALLASASTATVLLLWHPQPLHASDWPQFRGPDGQGHAAPDKLPIKWSETENVVWKVPVPGQGWSSPVILGNQIWMTAADEKGRTLSALCFDKQTGEQLHQIEVLTTEAPGPHHPQNGFASPTPVLDAERVYVHFGPRGTACLNREGEVLWKNTQYKYEAFQGAASSPILHGDLLILTCDGTDHQFLVALNKRTGEEVWKTQRQHLEEAASRFPAETIMSKIAKMAYSTPLIQSVNGVDQLVSSGADHVAAYDVNTGKELWWMPYVGFSQVARPSYGNGLFYVVGSVAQDQFCVFAVRPGNGKLGAEELIWQRSKGVAHVPSPILVQQRLYIMDNSGVAACLDALTGEELWKERIGGNFDASPIEAGGHVYYVSRDGVATVLDSGRDFRVLSSNELDGTFKASPAVSDGAIFLRSDTHLYRIEQR
jgi:outer membrane protein assembly factor BamB